MREPAVGIEIELLAPSGMDRRVLAQALAAGVDGSVLPYFELGAEPSAHSEVDIFFNLTPAFAVTSNSGRPVATLVDDPTIIADLNCSAPPKPGWHRVVSDDRRLLRLLERHLDPMDPAGPSLEALCQFLGLDVDERDGVHRLTDSDGASLALVTRLPGERERPTEVVSPPLTAATVRDWLLLVLETAVDLGFTAPVEGAVHLHFDARPFDDSHAFRRLAHWYWSRQHLLRDVVGTNLGCRMLAPWPQGVLDAVSSSEYLSNPWSEVKRYLARLFGHNYFDINVMNLLRGDEKKLTIEMRFFPVSLDVNLILSWVWAMGGVLSLLARPTGSVHGIASADLCLSSAELATELDAACKLRVLGPSGLAVR